LRTEMPRLRLGVIQFRGAAVDPHPSALAVEAHEQQAHIARRIPVNLSGHA